MAHFFHVVSDVKPMVWIGLYLCAAPIFALIYWALPEGQFRIPDDAPTDYGSWLYYSIVTISTLGFGDYTPAHGAAQAVTAVEVMCGLIFLGLFLNAVGAMKSEIDIASEIEKQKALHHAQEADKLKKSVPMIINALNIFLAYCYAVTTPHAKRAQVETNYNPDFSFNDLQDMFKPSGLPFDRTNLPAVGRLMHSAAQTSLLLDSLQQRIDLSLWPSLLEDCFAFVADFQMFSNTNIMFRYPDRIVIDDKDENPDAQKIIAAKIANWSPDSNWNLDQDLKAVDELYRYIKQDAKIAMQIETFLSELALKPEIA